MRRVDWGGLGMCSVRVEMIGCRPVEMWWWQGWDVRVGGRKTWREFVRDDMEEMCLHSEWVVSSMTLSCHPWNINYDCYQCWFLPDWVIHNVLIFFKVTNSDVQEEVDKMEREVKKNQLILQDLLSNPVIISGFVDICSVTWYLALHDIICTNYNITKFK